MTAVMWFRRDLRIRDNRALFHACKESEKLILLFQVEPEQFIEDSLNHQAFFTSLAHFQEELNRSMHLQILYGNVEECFLRLKEAVPDWTVVYYNQDETGFGAARDQKVSEFFNEYEIAVQSYTDHYLHSAKEIRNKSGEAYKVFTPYYRQWLQLDKPVPIQTELSEAAVVNKQLFPKDEHKLQQMVDGLSKKSLYPVGEKAAAEQLERFIHGKLDAYEKERDFPFLDSTSHLSSCLRTGELSIRTVWQKVQEEPDSPGKQTFIKELCWRDFYNMIYSQHPKQKEEPIQKEFEFIEWENNREQFSKWQNGQTGYPIVDAAMRQLKETGWMHNRLRMITASFLTKDLLIDWRWGESYFQKMLIDYDPASNIGGWQWAASTGTDAVPYFRIFNPVTQSRKFDRQGEFIRSYVPELQKITGALLHEPWKLTEEQQETYGVTLGQEYPLPIVIHQEARKRALRSYEASKALAKENADPVQ